MRRAITMQKGIQNNKMESAELFDMLAGEQKAYVGQN